MATYAITVIANIVAKDGMEKKVREELQSLIDPSRVESGCLAYNLHGSAEKKTHFMFYECWKSKSDLDEHLQKPYIKAFMKKAEGLLAEPIAISLWTRINE